jgi:hypothetical protein
VPASRAAAAAELVLDTQHVRFRVPATCSVAVNFDTVVLKLNSTCLLRVKFLGPTMRVLPRVAKVRDPLSTAVRSAGAGTLLLLPGAGGLTAVSRPPDATNRVVFFTVMP